MTPPTVAVTGFGRCGSSMVMRMLEVGGFPLAPSGGFPAYETHRISIATSHPGEAIKVLDGILHGVFPPGPARSIWLDRDHLQQARSQVKFLRGIMGTRLEKDAVDRFRHSYRRDRPRAIRELTARGSLLIVEYEAVLRDPAGQAQRIADHVGDMQTLDLDAMAAVVHARSPRCAPDLAFELQPVPHG